MLLEPPVKPTTYLLWFGPLALLVIGGLAILVFFRQRRGATGAAPLSPDEEARLNRLMRDDSPGDSTGGAGGSAGASGAGAAGTGVAGACS